MQKILKKVYEMYYDYNEQISKIKPHRVINRAKKLSKSDLDKTIMTKGYLAKVIK